MPSAVTEAAIAETDTERTSEPDDELEKLKARLDEKLRRSRHSMRKACSKAARLRRRVQEEPDSLRPDSLRTALAPGS